MQKSVMLLGGMSGAGQLNRRIIFTTLPDNTGLTGAPTRLYSRRRPSSLMLQGVSQEQVSP